MHWKDAMIKSSEFHWKKPLVENVEDGKLDVIVNIPLTSLYEKQAKRAFTHGMLTMLQFNVKKAEENSPIDISDLVKLFTDCGLPEIAKKIKMEASSEQAD